MPAELNETTANMPTMTAYAPRYGKHEVVENLQVKEFARLFAKYGCVEMLNRPGYTAMAPVRRDWEMEKVSGSLRGA